jgi:hypothetical protein
MSYQDAFDRIDRRLGLAADVAYERARRDVAAMRRADDAERQERRDRVRKDASRCGEHQRNYDDVFERLGKKAPPPTADDNPPDYRRQLFRIGQSMLPSDHELTELDPEEIGPSEIVPLEKQLLEALAAEGETPTGDNVAETPYDPRAMRTRQDSFTGERKVEYHAKRSFIADMSRKGRRVLRIINPVTGDILFGPAYPSARPR